MEEFKHNVEAYIEVLRNEKEQAKTLADIRGQKRKMVERLKQYMKQENMETADITDIATLTRVPKHRIQALKRNTVEAWAAEILGEGSLQEVDKLYDSREVKTVEELVVKA